MATITMGNDEFILYIRKTSVCKKSNDLLGREIWEWLKVRGALKTVEDMPCLWGKSANNIGALLLPQTATQFEFQRNLLPDLYSFLDTL